MKWKSHRAEKKNRPTTKLFIVVEDGGSHETNVKNITDAIVLGGSFDAKKEE